MHKIRFHPDARGQSGFTLVELLVAMTVLALLLGLTAQLVSSASLTIAGSNKRMDADSQSRLVFSRLGQDIACLAKRSDVDFSTFKQPEFKDPLNPANNLPANLQDGSDALQDHNDRFAFYSENIGGYTPPGTTAYSAFSASARAPLSLIAYQVAAEPQFNQQAAADPGSPQKNVEMTLRRMAKALGWDQSTTWACPVYLPLKLTGLQVNGTAINLFSTDPTNPNPTPAADPDYATIGDMVFRFEYSYLLKANATTPTARLS